MPQGLATSPYITILAGLLAYNLESLKLFLENFPVNRDFAIFKTNDISTILILYFNDALIFSPIEHVWTQHVALIHFFLFIMELVGLK